MTDVRLLVGPEMKRTGICGSLGIMPTDAGYSLNRVAQIFISNALPCT